MTEQTPEYTRSVALSDVCREVEACIELSTVPEPTAKAAVLFYSFRNEHGREIDPLPGASHSQKFGYFVYLPTREGETSLVQRIAAPAEATHFLAGVADWEIRLGGLDANLQLVPLRPSAETVFDNVSTRTGVPLDEIVLSYPVRGEVDVEFSWAYRIAPGAQGLLLFQFLDNSGEILLPPSSLSINAELGAYAYVDTGSNNASRTSLTMRTPARAAEMRVSGSLWRGDAVFILERPQLVSLGPKKLSRTDQAAEWVASLKPDDDLLIIHTTAGAIRDGNTLLLRSNRLALSLSERGWKVVFVPFSGFASQDAEWVISRSLLQVPNTRLASVVSQMLARCTSGRKVYLCSSRTDVSAIALQNRLQDHGWKTVYEIRDDMEEFQRVGYSRWYRAALEERFSREADGVIATSPRLAERVSIIAEREDVELIPNAAPDVFIKATAGMRNVQHFEAIRTKPIVGYLGHLTNSWFDWLGVLEMMRQLPKISFEIIGHGMPETVHLPINAQYLGAMGHSEALPTMSRWRVGIIPFTESRLTYGVDPNKLYEYVALGIRTVSAPMGRVVDAPGAAVYSSVDEFTELVDTAAAIEPTADYYHRCEEFLAESSWSARTQEVDDYLRGALL